MDEVPGVGMGVCSQVGRRVICFLPTWAVRGLGNSSSGEQDVKSVREGPALSRSVKVVVRLALD